ncbi:hypothetical protein [Streptococcus marmotae]|uniref:hypothetical protein n=1 Tax=Streptococcus marmotae TaxID=1825069 RepID=UPI0012FDD5FB|nr:hypothetical protein [Streptococcus marmotae]
MYYGDGTGVHACGKLFRKSVLIQHPYPIGKLYEETFATPKHVLAAEKIAMVTKATYNYYRRAGSITTSSFTAKQLDFFEAIEENEQSVIPLFPNHPQILKALQYRQAIYGIALLDKMYESHEYELYRRYRKEIGKLYRTVLFNKKGSRVDKIRYLLFLISPKLYNIVKNWYQKTN